jgi:DNA primase
MGAERRGGFGKYLCPFHSETEPSFWVFDTDEGFNLWTCAHGTAPVGRCTANCLSQK